jgi:hypothetical protein
MSNMDNSANEWREDEVKKVIEEFNKKISSCSLTETDICCGIEQLSILHVEEWLRTTLQNLLDQHTAYLVERIVKDIETDPEIQIPRPYEVAWILTKLDSYK